MPTPSVLQYHESSQHRSEPASRVILLAGNACLTGALTGTLTNLLNSRHFLGDAVNLVGFVPRVALEPSPVNAFPAIKLSFLSSKLLCVSGLILVVSAVAKHATKHI